RLLQARVVARVSGEETVISGTTVAGFLHEVFVILEHLDDLHHRVGVITCTHQVFGSKSVCFQFHLSTVTAHQRTAEEAGSFAKHRGASGDHRGYSCSGGEDVGGASSGLLTHGVARRDVAKLMTQNRGELIYGSEQGHQATVDVDVTAGQGERIDVRAVDDREVIFEVRTMRDPGEALAHLFYIGLQCRVLIYRRAFHQLVVFLLADFEFASFAHQYEVGTTGRVAGAAAEGEQYAQRKRGRLGRRVVKSG